MTDRFYPLGKHSAEGVWKSSYEVANEMRSFQRSAYPPGYAGHEPGSREKFGFSSPGPEAVRLTKGSLCLCEDTNIAEPRRMLAQTRQQVNDERQNFRDLDMPEMDRSYKSAIVSPAFRSMAKTRSLPTLERQPAPPRLSDIAAAQSKLGDDHFTYFVPKDLSREATDRLMARSLPKLWKDPQKRVMLPNGGDGTGFRTSCANTEWWPAATRLHEEPSSYASHFAKPSFYRMSPLSVTSRSFQEQEMRRSVQFNPEPDSDGFGSIRLGTPTLAARIERKTRFSTSPMLDSGVLKQSGSAFPAIEPTPAARFGYMPPGVGRIDRSISSSTNSPPRTPNDSRELSNVLIQKVLRLYGLMDDNANGSITRAEAKMHFRKFGEVSADAMFNEVDEDGNGEVTLEEFVDFWQQVKRSGYPEDDLSDELDELIEGNAWVDYADDREVGFHMRGIQQMKNL